MPITEQIADGLTKLLTKKQFLIFQKALRLDNHLSSNL